MTNVTTAKRAGGWAAALAAVIACLVGFGVVDWTEAESGAVVICAVAAIAVAAAVRAHVRTGTSAEPVALFGSLASFASTVVGLLLVFDVVTAEQGGLLAGAVAAIASAIGVPLVWNQVYPASNVQQYDHVEPIDAFYAERALPPGDDA